MGDIVNLDDVIRKEMERNNVTKPGEMVLNPVNREEPSNSLMTVATTMRTAADDIESCIELADDILGFICEKTGLDYGSFTIEDEHVEFFMESLQDSDLRPVIYTSRMENGVTYKFTVCFHATDEDESKAEYELCMYEEKKAYVYNFSTGKWLLIGEDRTSDKMREILSMGSPESEILSELMQANQGTLNEKKYLAIKKNHAPLFLLYEQVCIYMEPICELDETGKKNLLYLEPRDPFRTGFRVGWNGKEFVLYQYLDPYEFSEDGVVWTIDGKEPKIYMKEVDWTSDIQAMFFCVSALADHYIEDRKITVPLSLSAFTEGKKLDEIGESVSIIGNNFDMKKLSSVEEENLQEINEVINPSFYGII